MTRYDVRFAARLIFVAVLVVAAIAQGIAAAPAIARQEHITAARCEGSAGL